MLYNAAGMVENVELVLLAPYFQTQFNYLLQFK